MIPHDKQRNITKESFVKLNKLMSVPAGHDATINIPNGPSYP